jgi:hypothetical protein
MNSQPNPQAVLALVQRARQFAKEQSRQPKRSVALKMSKHIQRKEVKS